MSTAWMSRFKTGSFPKNLHNNIQITHEPLFDYCDVLWGDLNKTLPTRPQKLQNRAARIITPKVYDLRSTTIREVLRWDDLETTRRKHIAIIMYKIVNKRALGYLIDLFEKGNSVYSFRESGSRLLLPKYNIEFGKGSSFASVEAKVWNSIPFNIRSATSLSAFKSVINSLAIFYLVLYSFII